MASQGQQLASYRFTAIFEREDEGGFHVFCPALPGCHTQAETMDEGMVNIREAVQLYLESLREDGLAVREAAPGLEQNHSSCIPGH